MNEFQDLILPEYWNADLKVSLPSQLQQKIVPIKWWGDTTMPERVWKKFISDLHAYGGAMSRQQSGVLTTGQFSADSGYSAQN